MYEKQNWKNGDVITEEKLNHMEEGIASSVLVVNENDGTLDKTWQEILDAYQSGTVVLIKYSDSSDGNMVKTSTPVCGISFTSTSPKNQKYSVRTMIDDGVSAVIVTAYYCATSNDYPSIIVNAGL